MLNRNVAECKPLSCGHQFLWLLVMGEADFNQVDAVARIPKCGKHHTSLVHNVSVVSRVAGIANRERQGVTLVPLFSLS
jgi:hypothetical protein